MRKKTLKSIACAAAITLALSVTACGGSNDSTSNTDTAAVEDTADTIDTETETEEPADVNNDEAEADAAEEAEAGSESEFATLEEAFSAPGVKEEMDRQISSMDMEGMEISYEVTGNDFIVIYKVIDTTIDDPDDFAEQVDPVMDQLGTIFSSVAQSFDEALGQEGATSVIVRFLDANDTTLIERSYKAE